MWLIQRLALILLILPLMAFAKPLGKLSHADGQIKIIRQGQVIPEKVNPQQLPVELFPGDKVQSQPNSEARIRLVDNSLILLQSASLLILHNEDHQKLEQGRVLYDVRKRGTLKGLKVSTRSATIGVKGTQFLVQQDEEQQKVLLNEGVVELVSDDDLFLKPVQDQMQAFENYQKDITAEFEEYQNQMNKEFQEYVRSLTMEAGQGFAIGDQQSLTTVEFTEQDNRDFSRLNKFAAEE